MIQSDMREQKGYAVTHPIETPNSGNKAISACAAVADGDRMYQPVKARRLPGGRGREVLATLRQETASFEADLAKALES